MVTSIFVASYLGVGTLFGTLCVWNMNDDIRNKENGEELDNESETRLYALEKLNKILGGKMVITLIFIGYSLLWLPSLLSGIGDDIVNIFKKK